MQFWVCIGVTALISLVLANYFSKRFTYLIIVIIVLVILIVTPLAGESSSYPMYFFKIYWTLPTLSFVLVNGTYDIFHQSEKN